MNASELVVDILRQAFQVEADGFTFYTMTAARAEKPAVRELFAKLAQDEAEHQEYLKTILRDLDERGAEAFALSVRRPELGAFSEQIFTDRFRQQAGGAEFETAVLSIGMQLESNAIAHYARAASQASERGVKEFFRALAEWEREHLDALQRLYNAVRVDTWAEAGFAPF